MLQAGTSANKTAQGTAGPEADDQRVGHPEKALKLSCRRSGNAQHRVHTLTKPRHHPAARQAIAVAQRALHVHAGTNPVIEAHLDQPIRHRPADQTLGTLATDAHLGGDLVLRHATDVVEPPRAGGLILDGGFGVGLGGGGAAHFGPRKSG